MDQANSEPKHCDGVDQDALDDRDTSNTLNHSGHLVKGERVIYKSPFVPSVPNDVVSAQPFNISYNNSATASQYIIPADGDTLLAAKDQEISSLKAQLDEVAKKLQTTERENHAKEQKYSMLEDMLTSVNADIKKQKERIKDLQELNRKLEETKKELTATNNDLDERNQELTLQCSQGLHYMKAATNNMISAQLAFKFASVDSTLANQAHKPFIPDEEVQDPSQITTAVISVENMDEGSIVPKEASISGDVIFTIHSVPATSNDPQVLNVMEDVANGNVILVVNTLGNCSEDSTGCLKSLNGQLPENGEPYSSQDGNEQGIHTFSGTVLENQGKRTHTGYLEQDVLGANKRHKNSVVEYIFLDPEEPANEVEGSERPCFDQQQSTNTGSQNTSYPDGAPTRVNLLGFQKPQKNPDSIPGTSTGGSLPLKEKKSRDRNGKKPFDWKDYNLPLLKAMEKRLMSQGSEKKLSESSLLEDARKDFGDDFPDKVTVRSQWNNLLGWNLLKDGMEKKDVEFKKKLKLIKENLLRCIPVITAILENNNNSSALNALLDEIKREDEAKNKKMTE